jgi:tetratricopeptide (TPR) repeat protein
MSTLGLYYSQDGQSTLAEPLERQVLEIETRLDGPNDRATLGELGNWATTILLYWNHSRSRVNEVLGLVRKASQANPQNDYLLATLGLAEYRSGHWLEAINATGKAITSNEKSSPALNFILSMAQWRNGSHSEALRSFSKGVEGMKEFPVLGRTERALWTEAAILLGKTPPPKIQPETLGAANKISPNAPSIPR